MVVNKTKLRQILAAAAGDGWKDLYWMVQATAPGHPTFAAAYPGVWIPVIAVAPDPEITRHWAHMLQEFMKAANPRLTFEVALTTIDLLSKVKWYRWDDMDHVCDYCGAIGFPCAIAKSCYDVRGKWTSIDI